MNLLIVMDHLYAYGQWGTKFKLTALLCLYTKFRFEAKHQYFKKVAQRINNFKNISKSLAMRHQFLHLYNKFSIEPTLELGRG